MESQTPRSPAADPAPKPNPVTGTPIHEDVDRREAELEDEPTAREEGLDLHASEWKPLHPLPRGLVQLYGLLAVLFVLVPEWVAGGALLGFRDSREGSMLPPPSGAWRRLPELRLASLSLAEMRLLAAQLSLRGYARVGRGRLTERLLKRLRKQR